MMTSNTTDPRPPAPLPESELPDIWNTVPEPDDPDGLTLDDRPQPGQAVYEAVYEILTDYNLALVEEDEIATVITNRLLDAKLVVRS